MCRLRLTLAFDRYKRGDLNIGDTNDELHPDYIVDENLNRRVVILPYSEWENISEEMEELDDVRAYDKAKTEANETIPFEQAVKEIESGVVK